MTAWLMALALCTAAWAGRKPPPPDQVIPELVEQAMASGLAYDRLVELSDDIGHRLSGSESLDRAIDWAAACMEADGLEVRRQPVMVPVWVRGEEALTLTAPRHEALPVLALGGTVGTPEGGVEGEVVVVDSFEHLEQLGDAVRGKIVLFDVAFTHYGDTVHYRYRGAGAAARHGAVAVLVRSIGPTGDRLPHTGSLEYAEDAPEIPAAAVAAEDAMRLRRYVERGITPRVRLVLGSHFLEDAPSANVIGEVPGRRDEVVLIGCHLDSWDVGQGSQDDGGGCVAVMEAARLIAAYPARPTRTIRVVLFTNEENGLRGARAYAEAHADEVHVGAIESDTGLGAPQGFRVHVIREDEAEATAIAQAVIAQLEPTAALLAPIGAGGLRPAFGGSDLMPLARRGVVALGVDHDQAGYWTIHHTRADTMDKVDPDALRRTVAVIASMAWALSERPPVVDSRGR